jgi:hypothetical protein
LTACADHRSDDAEKLDGAVVIALGLEMEVDADGTDSFPSSPIGAEMYDNSCPGNSGTVGGDSRTSARG